MQRERERERFASRLRLLIKLTYTTLYLHRFLLSQRYPSSRFLETPSSERIEVRSTESVVEQGAHSPCDLEVSVLE
jgi:hypothetical protein